MKKIIQFFLFFILLLHCEANYSQSESCAILTDPNQPAAAGNPCFNIDSIYNNCIPIYLKVNVHFFTNDNCKGVVTIQEDPNQVKQESATGWANYMIWQANESLKNNLPQLNAGGYNTNSSAPHCNPIRYVLAGVYFHCNEAARKQGYSLGYLSSTYGVNVNSELNIFISSSQYANHNSASGAAYLGGSISSVNRLDFGILNHELAHNFDLDHSWVFDYCEDTPNLTFQWDRNCNGQIDPGVDAKEEDQRCFEKTPSTHALCNPIAPCTTYPCCDPGWINNNITAYNNPNGAWTDCQIQRALANITFLKCDMIAQIGGNCPPPNAFILRLPQDVVKSKHCSFCFDLDASTNYNQYKVEIYDNSDPSNLVLIRATNFLNGPAKTYCISGPFLSSAWQDGMIPGRQYLIKLIVKNDCFESNKTFPFVLPIRNCTIDGDTPKNDPAIGFQLSPNPTSDYINIQYQLTDGVQVKIDIMNQLLPFSPISVIPLSNQTIGTYSYNVNISALPFGSNLVIIQAGQYIYSQQFIRQ